MTAPIFGAACVGAAIGMVVIGVVLYVFTDHRKDPHGLCSHTIYALRVTVDTHDFGADYRPADMRWRWNIYQVGLDRGRHPHPVMLGNAATEEEAVKRAHAWIDEQTLTYAGKPMPAVVPV